MAPSLPKHRRSPSSFGLTRTERSNHSGTSLNHALVCQSVFRPIRRKSPFTANISLNREAPSSPLGNPAEGFIIYTKTPLGAFFIFLFLPLPCFLLLERKTDVFEECERMLLVARRGDDGDGETED